jgi:hypothetical protein
VRLQVWGPARSLNWKLFEVLTGQRWTKAVTVKTGTLVYVTMIAPARYADPEAGWSPATQSDPQLQGSSQRRY